MRPPRRKRALQVQTHPRLRRAAGKLPPYPPAIAGARARNRFLKLIRITGTRFSRRKINDKSAAFLPASLIVLAPSNRLTPAWRQPRDNTGFLGSRGTARTRSAKVTKY